MEDKTNNSPKDKICPRCGAQFLCYSQTNQRCWCADFTLHKSILERLAKDYNGCLCPQCMEWFAKEPDNMV